MRPVPAQRIGHAHGLLNALAQRDRLRLEDLLSDFPERELYPPGLENPAGRTRQYVSCLRAAGLVRESGGSLELTDLGKRYVSAGDVGDVFSVSPGQAEWLRRQLREKHLLESIWKAAAIALSLYASLQEGETVQPIELGRAAAHVGRAGWDSEQTFRSQGERLTQLLLDLELIGPDRRLTPLGHETVAELTVPEHPPMRELGAQLQHPQADVLDDEAIKAPEDPPEADDTPIAGPDEPTRSYPKLSIAAEGVAGSSVAEAAAPELPGEPVPAPTPTEETVVSEHGGVSFQSGIRPRTAVSQLRPGDLAAWKAEEAGRDQFLDPAEVRAAAERRGLVIDPGVYAAVIAALASGRHLVLTGGAGSGKTSLALAIAEAAEKQGRSKSVLLTGAGEGLSEMIANAIGKACWLVVDELDRVELDPAFGAVSTVLGGQGVVDLSPPDDWRLIATMADVDQVGGTSQSLRRRFVFVELPELDRADLETLVDAWAGGDETAAAVGRRLVAVNDVAPLGPGLYRDAVSYVRARHALAEAEIDDLVLEALAGFVLPQLEGQGDDLAARAVRAAGFDS